MSRNKDDVFYGGADDERLTHASPYEYLEHLLDGLDSLPDEVEVRQFHREQLPAVLNLRPLESILESLDEEYGDWDDGTPFEPTERMKAAETAFMAVVRAEYVPWRCEQTGAPIKVDIKAWVREHKPWENWRDLVGEPERA